MLRFVFDLFVSSHDRRGSAPTDWHLPRSGAPGPSRLEGPIPGFRAAGPVGGISVMAPSQWGPYRSDGVPRPGQLTAEMG